MNKSVGVYFNVLKKNIVVDRISVQTYKNALSGLDKNYVISVLRATSKNLFNHESTRSW